MAGKERFWDKCHNLCCLWLYGICPHWKQHLHKHKYISREERKVLLFLCFRLKSLQQQLPVYQHNIIRCVCCQKDCIYLFCIIIFPTEYQNLNAMGQKYHLAKQPIVRWSYGTAVEIISKCEQTLMPLPELSKSKFGVNRANIEQDPAIQRLKILLRNLWIVGHIVQISFLLLIFGLFDWLYLHSC